MYFLLIATCPLKTPHIPSSYSNEQTTKEAKAINNSYIYIHISCKCDTNRAGHFTLDVHASRPVACNTYWYQLDVISHPCLTNSTREPSKQGHGYWITPATWNRRQRVQYTHQIYSWYSSSERTGVLSSLEAITKSLITAVVTRLQCRCRSFD